MLKYNTFLQYIYSQNLTSIFVAYDYSKMLLLKYNTFLPELLYLLIIISEFINALLFQKVFLLPQVKYEYFSIQQPHFYQNYNKLILDLYSKIC